MATSISNTSNETYNCDACHQIHNTWTDARYLCTSCNHHLCGKCLGYHNKKIVTRNHEVIKLCDNQSDESDFQVSGRCHNIETSRKSKVASDGAIRYDSPSDRNLSLAEKTTEHIYKSVTFTRGLNTCLESDGNLCEITGIAVLQDNIFVSDTDNLSLKFFNKSCEFKFEYKFVNKPFDIDKFNDKTIVVSFCEHDMCLLSVCYNTFSEKMDIKTDYGCNGLCCYDSQIYCVLRHDIDSNSSNQICVYTPDGRLSRKLEKLSDADNTYFDNLLYITVNPSTGILYVTDQLRGILVLTTEGDVLAVMAPTELQNPQGITTDDYGQIYVCGCGSSNLVQMLADGTDVKEILSVSPRCKRAQCIKISGNKLFLSGRDSVIISLFELS